MRNPFLPETDNNEEFDVIDIPSTYATENTIVLNQPEDGSLFATTGERKSRIRRRRSEST